MSATLRLTIVVSLLLATAAFTHAARSHPAPAVVALDTIPMTLNRWTGADAGALDPETTRILAADSYLNRTYLDDDGALSPVGLYVAYYAQQRPGVSIHSPLHCLPGTGWEPVDVATRTLDESGGGTASVRRLVVRKARDRAVVLYWYAVHGRTIGSEIASKAWLLRDSLVLHRSDAALVRVVVPVSGSIESAEREGVDFVRGLLPHVSRLWS
jgi:EpsI family protein